LVAAELALANPPLVAVQLLKLKPELADAETATATPG
jgi:hypothetical protein